MTAYTDTLRVPIPDGATLLKDLPAEIKTSFDALDRIITDAGNQENPDLAIQLAALRREIGATTAPAKLTLQNGFRTATGDPNEYQLVRGDVEISLICFKDGGYSTRSVVAVLPEACWPVRRQYVTAIYSGAAKEVQIEPDGRIIINDAGNGGIAFSAKFRAKPAA